MLLLALLSRQFCQVFAGAVNTEVACGANANEAVDVLHAGHKSPVCKMCYTSTAQYTLYKRAGGTVMHVCTCVYKAAHAGIVFLA